jgi:hypothetical protein
MPILKGVLWYVPWLLVGSYLRDLTAQICIARQWIAKLFLIDALYFLGSLAILTYWHAAGQLALATQVMAANVISAFAASVIGTVLTFRTLSKISLRVRRKDLGRFLSFGKYTFGTGLGPI